MEFKITNEYKKLTDQEILDDVKRVLNELGTESIKSREYFTYGKYGKKAIENHFGSWNGLLKKLNLTINRENIHLTKEDIFKIIEELWIQKQKQPTINEFESTHHTIKIIKSNFGTWMNCLHEFVEYENKINKSFFLTKNAIKHKTSPTPSLSLRYQVLNRDKFKCVKCGRSPANDPSIELHIDHIVPYSKGGETILDNLQTLCQHCNLGKGNKFNS